jgi:ABC-2 type transport system permease protein
VSLFTSLVGLFLRLLATRGRVVVLTLLTLGMIPLAIYTGNRDLPQLDTWRLFQSYALGGIVPVSALVLGSSAFGDLIDDRTLVHLWLRPANRLVMVISAWVAVVIVCLPFSVLGSVAALAVAGMPGNAITNGALSCALGTVAYSAVFLALGLRVRRALAWGLAYILIWEGVLANVGSGLARIALRLSTKSIAYRKFADAEVDFALGVTSAVIALVVVAVGALALANRWLSNAEVA